MLSLAHSETARWCCIAPAITMEPSLHSLQRFAFLACCKRHNTNRQDIVGIYLQQNKAWNAAGLVSEMLPADNMPLENYVRIQG